MLVLIGLLPDLILSVLTGSEKLDLTTVFQEYKFDNNILNQVVLSKYILDILNSNFNVRYSTNVINLICKIDYSSNYLSNIQLQQSNN